MVTSDPKGEGENSSAASTETSGDGHGALVRLLALGSNAWAVAVALPARAGGVHGVADWVLIALPLVALALGVRALARRSGAALGLLAVGVPVLLVTGVAARADPQLSDHYTPATTVLAALSVLAYVVAVAHALGRPPLLHATRETKLALAARARPAARSLRALVLGTTGTVALLLAVAVPALGSHETAVQAWGEAADEGRVLTAIVGATIACIATGAIVGPSLRAERPGAARDAALPITLSLVVAATGAIAWAILRSIGP